ncbi:unnamed protein product [Urochloa decumbens]|uniref:DUF569 domain-containing protein n=1 Tax=Urochloa decumbens TaxID=240449 RepID=A0ABC8XIQ3_9POAL
MAEDKGKDVVKPSIFTIGSPNSGDFRVPSNDSDDSASGRAAAAVSRRFDARGAINPGFGDPGASSSRAPPPLVPEIVPFVDGQYVRLRNRGRGGYLFANESGRGVSVDRRRGMVNTAWAVQFLRTADVARVFLRGAYGRYLGATRNSARFGLLGCYAAQRDFEYRDDYNGIWWSTAMGRCGSVVLFNTMDHEPRALRANGRYQRWNTEVTIGPVDWNHVSSMMEWEVQVVPLTLERPPYQPRSPNAIQWWRRSGDVMDVSFAYPWFGDNGQLGYQNWTNMQFDGRSLTELGNEIASQLGCGVQFDNMTLCVQAGRFGRPTPLLTDLPLRADPIIILVFIVGSQGHSVLRFPNLAAE